MVFGVLFNLVPIFIVGFGLYLMVKKETMEINNDNSIQEKGNEKVHPNTFANDKIIDSSLIDSSKSIYQQNKIGSKGEGVNPAYHLFLYLSSFFSLGFLIGGLLTTLFQFVNKYIPDSALGKDVYAISAFDDSSLKVGISMLLIASLVYFTTAYLINKKLEKGEIRPDSVVRKFITYIALFALVAISIGSLATLFYNYLTGELTSNSFGKIIAFFAVNGFFAAFYFWEVRRKDFVDKNFKNLYFSALGVAILVFIFGIVVSDSPQMTREKKIDESAISEMQSMNSNIEIFFSNNKRLPKADEIEKSVKFAIEYSVKTEKTYELCGEFLRARDKVDFYSKQWNHPAGKYCFKLNIDERQSKGDPTMPQIVQ